jgi:hypothetical protein
MAAYKEQYYNLEEHEMQELIAKAKGRKSEGTIRTSAGF